MATARKPKKQFWHKQAFQLTVDMFRVDVGVSINMSEAEIKRHWRSITKPAFDELCKEVEGWDKDSLENGGSTEGRMLTVLGGFVVLLNFPRGDFRKSVALLTHEMVHVTQYLLRRRRISLSEETEEIHAYLTEYLVEQALRRMY